MADDADVAIETGLGDVGQRREVKVAGIRVSGRRRRPSGEKEPLPRDLKASGWFWLAIGVFLLALWLSIFAWSETTSWWTDRDLAVLQWLVDMRNSATTRVMEGSHCPCCIQEMASPIRRNSGHRNCRDGRTMADLGDRANPSPRYPDRRLARLCPPVGSGDCAHRNADRCWILIDP